MYRSNRRTVRGCSGNDLQQIVSKGGQQPHRNISQPAVFPVLERLNGCERIESSTPFTERLTVTAYEQTSGPTDTRGSPRRHRRLCRRDGWHSESDSPTDDSSTTDSSDGGMGTAAFYVSDDPSVIDDFQHLNVTITKVGFKRTGDLVTATRTGPTVAGTKLTGDDGNESDDGTESTNRTDTPRQTRTPRRTTARPTSTGSSTTSTIGRSISPS